MTQVSVPGRLLSRWLEPEDDGSSTPAHRGQGARETGGLFSPNDARIQAERCAATYWVGWLLALGCEFHGEGVGAPMAEMTN